MNEEEGPSSVTSLIENIEVCVSIFFVVTGQQKA
jgi:hypothetical protein